MGFKDLNDGQVNAQERTATGLRSATAGQAPACCVTAIMLTSPKTRRREACFKIFRFVTV